MTTPRTRSEAKAAARQMAAAAMLIVEEQYIAHQPEGWPEEVENHLLRTMIEAMHARAETYRAAGVPPLWVDRFKSQFIHCAASHCRDLGIQVRPLA